MFDLSAGAACLDLVNTVENRLDGGENDLLSGYSDLVSWARQAGLIDETTARFLEREAAERPAEARLVLQGAVELREVLFRLFSGVAAGRDAAAGDLAVLNRHLGHALAQLRVASGPGGISWRWRADRTPLDRVLWPVARSAAEILTSRDRDRVRECASKTCRWLFLDRSRNRSRRWCDMQSCGNRHKVRKHYARKKRAG